MPSYRKSGYKPASLPTGIGCSFVLPTAFVGIGFLADFEGPGGWHSLAEVVGWAAICAGASFWCAFLLAKFRRDRRSSYLFPFASLGSAVAFLLLVIREARPATPAVLKEAYTTSFQTVGVAVVAVASMALVGWLIRRTT
jgi:hypothetical protein